jgi:transcriptional regulator with XRE-family HTH domain
MSWMADRRLKRAQAMRFFQQSLIPDPLGPVLQRAREKMKLSLAEAARLAGISEEEAAAFEEDRIICPGTARLHALSYARWLGLEAEEIRDSLPPAPGFTRERAGFLEQLSFPDGKKKRFSLDPLKGFLEALAPLGRAVLYCLLIAILATTWGLMRQLSRVRSIPWVTSNSRPALFHDR